MVWFLPVQKAHRKLQKRFTEKYVFQKCEKASFSFVAEFCHLASKRKGSDSCTERFFLKKMAQSCHISRKIKG
jgi:hypothetical protein